MALASARDDHLAAFAEALLRPYAQILLSRDLSVGALVLAAIACWPRLALATVAAVAVAALAVRLLGLGSQAVREGGVACIAVLTTLGLARFAPEGGPPLALLLFGVLFSVMFAASFQALFATVTLPAHALPFVAATWTVHEASRLMPASTSLETLLETASWLPPSAFASSWLDLFSALIFGHGALAGALILAAILVHSRISFLLAILGTTSVTLLRLWLRDGQPWSAVDLTAAFNGTLAAMAVGGLWFVPQPSSIALATFSAALTTLITYALFGVLAPLGLPVLSLPFVLAVLLVLTAARMREHDRWPRSTLPADHPEDALSRHLLRIRRFGNLAWLPFRLPFRGEWFVSQGHNGSHTHQGLWRHGLDFQGRTTEGKPYNGDGKELRDYVCYGLPVLAAGAGTVALVEDGVPDNRPGELNTQENWGNAVVVQHGGNLFSVCAHLQPKSIRVKVGDVVTPGMEIGRCGNSGRSPFPHLHFQIQRSKLLGSPTIAFEFGDVVFRRDGDLRLETHAVPDEESFVRPAQRDDGLARAVSMSPGMVFELTHRETGHSERAEVEIDVLGTRSLVSPDGRLVFDTYDNGLVFLDYSGSPSSLLRFLLLAWARLPFDPAPKLAWTDALSRRLFMPRWLRSLADLWIVLVPEFGKLDASYTLVREAGHIRVEGKAEAWSATSLLSLSGSEHTICVEHGAERATIVVKRIEDGYGKGPGQ